MYRSHGFYWVAHFISGGDHTRRAAGSNLVKWLCTVDGRGRVAPYSYDANFIYFEGFLLDSQLKFNTAKNNC